MTPGWDWTRLNQRPMDRIWHEKVTKALRQAGGVQFLSLLPGAVRVLQCEAAVTFTETKWRSMSKQWLKENQLEIQGNVLPRRSERLCLLSVLKVQTSTDTCERPQMIYRWIELNVWPQSCSLSCRWTLGKAPPVHLCLHCLVAASWVKLIKGPRCTVIRGNYVQI